MKHVFCLVAHNTWTWINKCLHTFREVFPKEDLIVVDNNIMSNQKCFGLSYNYDSVKYKESMSLESRMLSKRKDIHLILPDHHTNGRKLVYERWISHGTGIDRAVNWSLENGYEVITLIEPDCVFFNRKWVDCSLSFLSDECYAVAVCKKPSRCARISGASYLLQKIQSSFECQKIIWTKEIKKIATIENPVGVWGDLWDTGEKVWCDFSLIKKCKITNNSEGFGHSGAGSYRKNPNFERDLKCQIKSSKFLL